MRAECLPSTSDSKANERKHVFDVLKENNCSKHFLKNCLKPVIPSRKTSKNDNSMMCFAVVPYVHEITEPIKRILGSYNIKVAQKPFLTVSKEQKSDAIYSIPCNDCKQKYIEQTKCQFATRLKEHQKAVALSRKDNSALSEHTCQTNHTVAWNNSKIITTNQRYHQKRCLEAWYINSAHAPLNRDDGGLLADAYLHLINR